MAVSVIIPLVILYLFAVSILPIIIGLSQSGFGNFLKNLTGEPFAWITTHDVAESMMFEAFTANLAISRDRPDYCFKMKSLTTSRISRTIIFHSP